MITDKEINKIKLTVTTACNLRCNYCFVKRTSEAMSFEVAKKSVDILLGSRGKEKLLSIYGGEPLLNFELIKKICPYAIAKGKKAKKVITVSICSNFTLIEEQHLRFFKKNNIRLIISMAGQRRYHDKERSMADRNSSYSVIKDNLGLLFKIMPKNNVGVSFCVFPSTAGALEDNFNHLLELGFNYINLEIIREYEQWTTPKINKIAAGLRKIIRHILSRIPKRNFIFLNPINWEIKYKLLALFSDANCPFNYKLEVYPNGEMAFSPFVLNCAEKERYTVGNINEEILKKFNDCRFSLGNRSCRECESGYFKSYPSDIGASKVYKLYHLFCLEAAKEIQNSAPEIKPFAEYVREIKERICF